MLSDNWREVVIHGVKQFVYSCGGIYTYVILNYGARNAMVIFFGAFAFISLVLIRGEFIRKTTGGMRAFRTPVGIMVVKAFEGGVRFFASVSLVLGLLSMAHYQGSY